MKTFAAGLCCGVILAMSTTVLAADAVKAYLFPVTIQFQGVAKELGSRFAILNYEGHTYVPLRYMAEHLGAGAFYDQESKVVSVEPAPVNGTEADKQIWAVMYRLERGMSSKEVKPVLGDPSFVTLIESSRQQVSRYDLGAVSDYRHGGLDVDIEGLQKGKLQGQLVIRWTPAGNVERYDLWYAKGTGAGRTIHTHIVYPDGTIGSGLYE
jgi:hypothetical protein